MRTVFNNKTRTLLFLAAITTLAGLAQAALNFDAKKSTVTITTKQMNVPVTAKFNKINAVIDYTKEKPETARANVEIDIGSIDLGDAEYNKEVLKKEWFNGAQFPKATFASSEIKRLGDGKMTAAGKLTIKGKTLDVNFPVTIKKEGNSTIFDGTLPIHRLAFNVGEGEWKDTGMVADEVTIQFHVVTQ
jgi:polyisoprenoid-binding protein YceI